MSAAPQATMLQNPFESPGDASHLQERTVSSPSVFRPAGGQAAPRGFAWSIDELALIDPVEIDSEDIRRQALYLSQARVDKEAEEKRQKAIEEFFTRSVIVPSPWSDHSGKQVSQLNSTRCVDANNTSLVGQEAIVHPGKNNAACQTVLSLPVDFDMEKILGDYFRAEEWADQSQESLSSSSLRRKLFLDENGSLSPEDLGPSLQPQPVAASLGVLCPIDLSPVRCRSPLSSCSSGQLSSSPIRGNTRAYSLGSLPSPSFPDRSPANVASPAFSPVEIQLRKTPQADQRQFTFRSPDLPSIANACRPAPAGTRSSYVECSPLRSPSPMRLWSCRGATLHQSSLARLPVTPEGFQEEPAEGAQPSPAGSPQVNGEAALPEAPLALATVSPPRTHPGTDQPGLVQQHRSSDFLREDQTVDMVDPEMLDENSVKGSVEGEAVPVAGLSMDMSVCMSPLAESSASPCESSSLQMDSGYNTQTCSSSLMDAAGAETSCKEHSACDVQKKGVLRTKHGASKPRHWAENSCQSSCHLIAVRLPK